MSEELRVINRMIQFLESGRDAFNGSDKQLAKIWAGLLREIDGDLPHYENMHKLGRYLGHL